MEEKPQMSDKSRADNLKKLRGINEVKAYLDAFYKNLNDPNIHNIKPPQKPFDDKSLTKFIYWLLLPTKYKCYPFSETSANTSTQPMNTSEWLSQLVQPQPYRIFCDKLLLIKPKEFENFVGDLFKELGCHVTAGSGTADGGIDLWLNTAQGKYIVQCKKWKNKVGEGVIRDIVGVTAKYQIEGAFVVTTSEFTDNAIGFAKDLNPRIGLMDGQELFALTKMISPSKVADPTVNNS